jgi:hypothetical protein
MLEFDKDLLGEALRPMDNQRIAVFAAASAARIVPLYNKCYEADGLQAPIDLAKCLAELWVQLEQDNPSQHRLNELRNEVSIVLPTDSDFDVLKFGGLYIENCTSAVEYAICAALGESAQYAVWCATQNLEALTEYLTDELDLDLDNFSDQLRFAEHPFVQTELKRQSEDLVTLLDEESTFPAKLSLIRQRNLFVKLFPAFEQ